MSDTTGKLNKIRALLDKANDEATTLEEAETYRGKAFELMAKYGIEQALLNEARPGSDKPADRLITLDNPWAREKAHLANGLAKALRCELIMVPRKDGNPGHAVHVFGYASDLERLDMLFTSLLLQMFGELARTPVPANDTPRAFRRSWILGFAAKVSARVREAEQHARNEATTAATVSGRSTDLVLADRKAVVTRAFHDAYPRRRSGGRTTMTGRGYGAGKAAGARADIGGSRIGGGSRHAISR
ncbi:MAG: DUF2786 domain-containing protein [Streptomycetaceae bacterium]|nr:DUF2786 domain-containing protein [Streptomycetaceae bacterium]